jgi:WD40 repeat protein
MNAIKAYFLSLSMITIISPLLLATRSPASLKDLTTNTLIKTILNCPLGECLSRVVSDKVPDDVREFLRKVLILQYRVLLLKITNSCPSMVFTHNNSSLESPAIGADGKYVLTGSGDNTARLWNIQDKDNIQSYIFDGHTKDVSSVALSPDGKFALTGSEDDTARLWDIQGIDNIQSYVLNGHTRWVTLVAFSPDGKFALTGSHDCTARLWDIRDINNIQSYVLKGHSTIVLSVAFSPDGKFALTGSHDNTARLWDIQDKHNIQSYVLNGHTNKVLSVTFSPDVQYALTGSFDDTARLWNLVEPLISMESLTLPMILLIIKLYQNPQDKNQILTHKHYSETFNACDDLSLKQAIMAYFKLESTTASLKKCILQ